METIIKKAVLIALLAFALICIAHDPLREMSMSQWLTEVIGSKIIGVIALAYFALLNREWRVYERHK